jgi:hypothetical protein
MKPLLLYICAVVLFASAAQNSDEARIWNEFVAAVKQGEINEQRVRPYLEALRPQMVKWLKMIGESVSWDELRAKPEVFRDGNEIHYLTTLTLGGTKDSYCFTLITEGGQWYFRHMESIAIRLDKIAAPPVSSFPEIQEQKKSWMREERQTVKQVQLFRFLAKEKGSDFAYAWFKDGAGYALEARTWVPFLPVPRAFVLYLCWEQASLNGNPVTLERLDENEAVVRIEPRYFRLHAQTGIGLAIPEEDYRRLFETIWVDRAAAAGWDLHIEYAGRKCVFRFSRKP